MLLAPASASASGANGTPAAAKHGEVKPKTTGIPRRKPKRRTRTASVRYSRAHERRPPSPPTSTSSSATPHGGRWGVMVVSLSRGDTLFALNADSALQPASNMKLFTSALALDQFGPQHQFHTEVLRTGAIAPDGTLDGDLILRGDGDPVAQPALRGRRPQRAHAAARRSRRRRRHQEGHRPPRRRRQRLRPAAHPRRLAHPLPAAVVRRARLRALAQRERPPGRRPRRQGERPAGRRRSRARHRSPGELQGAHRRRPRRAPRRLHHQERRDRSARLDRHARRRAPLELVVEDPTAFTAGAFRRALEARGITVDGDTQYDAAPPNAIRDRRPPLARPSAASSR